MKGLLDTHTLLWWDHDQSKLSSLALAFCQNTNNALFVSVASVWELQIKVATGKIALRDPLSTLITRQQNNGVVFVPVEIVHVYGVGGLPMHHKDPFDRVIIATAIAESATLISADVAISLYAPAVSVLW